MKKIITICSILISSLAFSQKGEEKFLIPKGTKEISGSIFLRFQDEKNDGFSRNDDDFRLGISPNFGYTIKDNLILGIGVGYNYSNIKRTAISTINTKENTNTFNFFPYIKKYFPLTKKLAIDIQGEIRYSYSKTKSTDNTNLANSFTRKENELFVGLRPGINYLLSDKFALKINIGSLGYTNRRNKFEDNESTKSNAFALNLDTTQLLFGLTFFLK